MLKIGITGGIGSGKTTFCREWEKLGAYVLFADDFAKELMHEDENLKNKIRETFGDQSYDEEGNLNRAFLAEEAFGKNRVEELNKLVHPVLRERTKILIQEKEAQGVEVFCYEAAVLLNNGRPPSFDYIVLLLAEEERRIERTQGRDQSSETEVRKRMNKQPDFESMIHLADFVVMNDGSLKELKKKAAEIFYAIQ